MKVFEAIERLIADDEMLRDRQRPEYQERLREARHALLDMATARPAAEYHEDMGPVLWWKFPIQEPPYVGTPNDLGQTVEVTLAAYGVDKLMRADVGGWPGDFTHFTPIPMPLAPSPL